MKTFTKIILVLAILLTMVIGVKSFEVQTNDNTNTTPTTEIATEKVLRIRYCTLKPGVDPQEFEQFVTEEFNPLMNEMFPGMPITIMKGDRGPEAGQYIVVWESSLHVRNFYRPESGGSSEIAKSIAKSYGDRSSKVQKRFDELAERDEFTDYVTIVE